ncbi:MAG: ABC transporter ATP-binding protein [Bacteroidota bacterium]
MGYIVSAKAITKYYQQTQPVLKLLDLCIEPGKFTVLMGASGSGKSTLLHLLGGLDRPSSGYIDVLGQRISDYREKQLAKFRRQNIGFVFQDHHLIHELTLKDNILLAGYLVERDKRKVQKRAEELLEQLGIASLAHRLPSEVSGGESQRAAIARALIINPKILMADEPTGNLNSKLSADILACFRDLHRAGQSILMVTHDITASLAGDEVYYMRDGKIVGHMGVNGTEPERKESLTNWLEKLSW